MVYALAFTTGLCLILVFAMSCKATYEWNRAESLKETAAYRQAVADQRYAEIQELKVSREKLYVKVDNLDDQIVKLEEENDKLAARVDELEPIAAKADDLQFRLDDRTATMLAISGLIDRDFKKSEGEDEVVAPVPENGCCCPMPPTMYDLTISGRTGASFGLTPEGKFVPIV